jgi:hypothetical protein
MYHTAGQWRLKRKIAIFDFKTRWAVYLSGKVESRQKADIPALLHILNSRSISIEVVQLTREIGRLHVQLAVLSAAVRIASIFAL